MNKQPTHLDAYDDGKKFERERILKIIKSDKLKDKYVYDYDFYLAEFLEELIEEIKRVEEE